MHSRRRLEAEFAAGKTLLRLAAPELVQAAEDKLRGKPVDEGIVEQAAKQLKAMPKGHTIDTLVLACTHFPLLEEELRVAFGQHVTLLHGAGGIARQVARLVEGQPFDQRIGSKAIATGDPEDFASLQPVLATYGIDHFEQF